MWSPYLSFGVLTYPVCPATDPWYGVASRVPHDAQPLTAEITLARRRLVRKYPSDLMNVPLTSRTGTCTENHTELTQNLENSDDFPRA